MPLDEKSLEELKLAEARLYQRIFASEYALNQQIAIHQAQEIFLAEWKYRLLAIAQRYENNPIQFCDECLINGKDWFTPPEDASPQQVRELLEFAPDMSSMMTEPVDLNEVDGKMILKRLQLLTAKPPGRKQSEEFGKALEWKGAGKNIHEICLELKIPGYEKMGSSARRVEHQRIRSGISRLEQKQKQNDISQRSRNIPR
jgi:hypothetical protein